MEKKRFHSKGHIVGTNYLVILTLVDMGFLNRHSWGGGGGGEA